MCHSCSLGSAEGCRVARCGAGSSLVCGGVRAAPRPTLLQVRNSARLARSARDGVAALGVTLGAVALAPHPHGYLPACGRGVNRLSPAQLRWGRALSVVRGAFGSAERMRFVVRGAHQLRGRGQGAHPTPPPGGPTEADGGTRGRARPPSNRRGTRARTASYGRARPPRTAGRGCGEHPTNAKRAAHATDLSVQDICHTRRNEEASQSWRTASHHVCDHGLKREPRLRNDLLGRPPCVFHCFVACWAR